jgi:hypothetical protein
VFAEQGHIAIGLEGAVHFAAMARAHSGCEVWQQDFLKLELPEKYSDGESWPDKLGQLDKWSFCLTTAKMAVEQERR